MLNGPYRALRFLVVCTAPTFGRHLLAAEHRAGAPRIGGLALIKAAVAASLAGRVLRILGLVDLSRVGFVAERLGVGIGLGDFRGVGKSLARRRERRRNANALNHERTTG